MAKQRKNLVSASYLKRKKRNFFLKGFLATVMTCGCAYGLIYFLNLPSLKINEIKISTLKFADSKNISEDVENILSGTISYFFPKNSSILYPRKEILENIKEDFPSVESLDVNLNKTAGVGYALALNLREKEPKLVWCDSAEEQNSCYFADENGFIFTSAPDFSDTTFIHLEGPLYFSTSSIDKVIGSTLPISYFISGFEEASGFLERNGYKMQRIVYDAENNFYFYIKEIDKSENEENEEFSLILNSKLDFTEALTNFILINRQYKLEEKKNSPKRHLEYADLRFGKNIVFKWK
ncbi:MAG: hypothetical protein Q7R78_01030 [bacterium]|nr:hypothetical protein [bacterium]